MPEREAAGFFVEEVDSVVVTGTGASSSTTNEHTDEESSPSSESSLPDERALESSSAGAGAGAAGTGVAGTGGAAGAGVAGTDFIGEATPTPPRESTTDVVVGTTVEQETGTAAVTTGVGSGAAAHTGVDQTTVGGLVGVSKRVPHTSPPCPCPAHPKGRTQEEQLGSRCLL